MHSERLKPTKQILIGTRTTNQATGDAGFLYLRMMAWHHIDHSITAVLRVDLNPFRTPVPFWGQGSQIPSNLSPIVPKTRLEF